MIAPKRVSSLWDKPMVRKPVKVSWLVQIERGCHKPRTNHMGRNEELDMKILTLSALVAVTSLATASSALAQDADAGKTSFNKCLACHAVGEGAKNKVGPVLNGLEGRHSGSIEGYSYTDANKNSGIVWSHETFKEYIKDPRARIPGTKMVFAGIKNDTEIESLWAYLKQFDAEGKKK